MMKNIFAESRDWDVLVPGLRDWKIGQNPGTHQSRELGTDHPNANVPYCAVMEIKNEKTGPLCSSLLVFCAGYTIIGKQKNPETPT
jgi:hypothetical protein